MKPLLIIKTALFVSVLTVQPVLADCDVTGSVNQQAGIAKDGTHAPLETEARSQEQPGPAEGMTTGSTTADSSAQKDGSEIPMGENSSVAMSGQDAEAQQQGEETAAAAAGQEKCD